jgi:3',5'-cyclic AMP phosphodiesterase CpdA
MKQSRRSLITTLGVVAAALALASPALATEREEQEHLRTLRFSPDRTFKVVQFTDTQDGQDTDPRTVALIGAVLDDQRPDLVVFTGDQLTSRPQTAADVRRAIDNIVQPMEARRIPWLVAFGNHDEDHTARTGLDREAQLAIYRSYRHNLNQPSPRGVSGSGNMQALVNGSRSDEPVFNVWALDSGKYAPAKVGEQVVGEDYLLGWTWMPTWDWIKPDQVAWYTRTSERLEREHGRKLPSLMFFHIPLQEWRQMYENDAVKVAHPEYGLAPQHGVVGERNEDECPGPFNSGLFAALAARGDVKGVFVGHDHVNDYVGDYFGVRLGYSANTGFATYGLGGAENHRMRGARVFVVREDQPEQFDTRMVFAADYGIR